MDMNAKDLIRRRITEADPVPPEDHPLGVPPRGRQYPPMPPSRPPLKLSGRTRTVPFRPPGSETGEEDFPPGGMDEPGNPMMRRMMGREAAPQGQFSPKEQSQLKDVMILILAKLANSDLDMQIAQALMAGKDLEPGQLQHILDEARNVPIPDSHGPLMQKIFSQISQPSR
jgi:hypothetical protein